MRSITYLFWVSLMVTGLAAGSARLAQADTVLVLGDSISAGYGIQRGQGWVDLLAQRLAKTQPRHEVVNASISGDTTGGGLARLPDLLRRHQPALVLVELGGNDGLRGYPTTSIRANITTMVQLAQRAQARVVIVAMEIPPNYGERYITAFRQVFRDVAQQLGVPLVPFLLGGVALNKSLMQADGIHPTAAAQPLLLETAWPAIHAALPPPAPAPAQRKRSASAAQAPAAYAHHHRGQLTARLVTSDLFAPADKSEVA